MKIMPLSELEEMGACEEASEVVRVLFPDGVPLDEESIEILRDNGVPVAWAGVRLLSQQDRREFVLLALQLCRPYFWLMLDVKNEYPEIADIKFRDIDEVRFAHSVLTGNDLLSLILGDLLCTLINSEYYINPRNTYRAYETAANNVIGSKSKMIYWLLNKVQQY